VNVEEIAFVRDEGIAFELFAEGFGDSGGLVFSEEADEAVFAALKVGFLSLQESVLEGSEGHEPEEEKACQSYQQVIEHEPGANGEGTHLYTVTNM
jgi:hypothetical protein